MADPASDPFPDFSTFFTPCTNQNADSPDCAGLPPFNPGSPGVSIVPIAPGSLPPGFVPFQGTIGGLDFKGPTLYQMVLAVVVVTAITFALPRRFAVWFPPIILLGYAATHQKVVQDFVNSLQQGASIIATGGT